MEGFAHFLFIFVCIAAVLVSLGLGLIFVVRPTRAGPAKVMVETVKQRMTATALATLIGLPLQAIPEVDGIYDIGAIIMLAFYWYGLKDKIRNAESIHELHGHVREAMPMLLKLARMLKRFRKR